MAMDASFSSRMEYFHQGPLPVFGLQSALSKNALEACPGLGIDYSKLGIEFTRKNHADSLVGGFVNVRTGYSANTAIRRLGASGGVLTQTLLHLFESGRVDAAILVRQGVPDAVSARSVIARTRDEILNCAQSVYIPVSTLDILIDIDPRLRYVMTCLPDQSAALRRMQLDGHPGAQAVKYVLGPYTGTALEPGAIKAYLKGAGVHSDDKVVSLNWRAGEWPGYLEIVTASGRVLRSKKVYYNFLIPFFITQASLQSMDFANEYADLSVGDAWSPVFEKQGGGFAVYLTRSPEMEEIVCEMIGLGLLEGKIEPRDEAASMHGHMIDFKKRGGYIRNCMRRALGLGAPDFGIKPVPIGFMRIFVELVVSGIFLVCRTPLSRWLVSKIPEPMIGPVFNRLRLIWKAASRPAKRRGLGSLVIIPSSHEK